MVKLGFTGSRDGMTNTTKEIFNKFINTIEVEEFHHGDCIGADKDSHDIISTYNVATYIHPPTNSSARAFCSNGNIKTIFKEKDYIKRNHDIVDSCDILLACPNSKQEVLRSGTWSTIRYAKKLSKPIIIFYPDGTLDKINNV